MLLDIISYGLTPLTGSFRAEHEGKAATHKIAPSREKGQKARRERQEDARRHQRE